MESFCLKSFGIGDGWPCVDRGHSSFLYQLGGAAILIDCGEPISAAYKRSGLSYDHIDRIFLSHTHCDHIGGFFMFMQGLWLEQREKPLYIHAPAEAIGPLRAMLNACYIFEELLGFELKYIPLQATVPVVIGDLKVTPFPSTHLESLRKSFQKTYPQPFEAFCFLLEGNGLRIGHSADIGAPDDLAPLLAEPLDLLVCELAHFKPKELFSYLQNHEIKKLALMHMARRHWETLEETRALAQRALGANKVILLHDNEEIRL